MCFDRPFLVSGLSWQDRLRMRASVPGHDQSCNLIYMPLKLHSLNERQTIPKHSFGLTA